MLFNEWKLWSQSLHGAAAATTKQPEIFLDFFVFILEQKRFPWKWPKIYES